MSWIELSQVTKVINRKHQQIEHFVILIWGNKAKSVPSQILVAKNIKSPNIPRKCLKICKKFKDAIC
jgi:uracil DNA glycosylase